MAAGLTASAGLLSGVSQYEAGQQRSTLFRANEAVASQQAQAEEAAGAYNESAVRMRAAAQTGQQVAQTGANGLQQAGTPAQVIASTAGINEMDALQVRNNALRKAWGFQVQAASDKVQEKLASQKGDFDAVGSLLSGGAKGYTEAQAAGSWF